MAVRLTCQDIFMVLAFSFLIFEILYNWEAYNACKYPIETFLLLTYSLFLGFAVTRITKANVAYLSRARKVLDLIEYVGFGIGFAYVTIQGIIWEYLNCEAGIGY